MGRLKIMPIGLHGAPATFQRMMDTIIQGAEEFATFFLDDLIIFGETWQDHIKHLEQILSRLRLAGLTAYPKKCQFAMQEVSDPWYVVVGGNVKPDGGIVIAVQEFPTPNTKTEVSSFLGLSGYYRKFIPDYSSRAVPLTNLTKKSSPNRVIWSKECEESFQQLKTSLCSYPVLRSPDFNQTFTVQTDVSNRGIGAVLTQSDENNEEHLIVYISRKLMPREQNYSVVEKECFVMVWAIQSLHRYLYGRQFVIQTYHHCLQWLDRIKMTNVKLTRWSLALQSYKFAIHLRGGKKNVNADCLSRLNKFYF